jgi:hypothetical protein
MSSVTALMTSHNTVGPAARLDGWWGDAQKMKQSRAENVRALFRPLLNDFSSDLPGCGGADVSGSADVSGGNIIMNHVGVASTASDEEACTAAVAVAVANDGEDAAASSGAAGVHNITSNAAVDSSEQMSVSGSSVNGLNLASELMASDRIGDEELMASDRVDDEGVGNELHQEGEHDKEEVTLTDHSIEETALTEHPIRTITAITIATGNTVPTSSSTEMDVVLDLDALINKPTDANASDATSPSAYDENMAGTTGVSTENAAILLACSIIVDARCAFVDMYLRSSKLSVTPAAAETTMAVGMDMYLRSRMLLDLYWISCLLLD